MEQSLLQEVESVMQQMESIQRPQLQSKVEEYLSLPPQPMKMEREMFWKMRELCIKPKYAPILQALVQEKNGVRILDPNTKRETEDGKVFRLLSEAIYNRAYPNAQILLSAGANPNAPACNAYEDYPLRESPLFTAVDFPDLSLLQLLLNAGADPNKHYEIYDNLPLLRAVQNYGEDEDRDIVKTTSVISLLLSYKANPDEKEREGNCNLNDDDDLRKYYTARELAEAYKAQEILALFNKKNETP